MCKLGTTITKDGKRIFTANGVSNDISIIDAATSRVIGSIDVGNRPWGVALDR